MLFDPYFKPYKEATIKRVFYFHKNIKRDKDNFNARCKCLTDGVKDAGVLEDDDKITWLPTEIHTGPNLKEHLEYHFYKLSYGEI